MTDTTLRAVIAEPASVRTRLHARLKRRKVEELVFRGVGALALSLAAAALLALLWTIFSNGYTAFSETRISLEVHFDPEKIDPKGNRVLADLEQGDYQALARDALRARFPEVTARRERLKLDEMLSQWTYLELREMVLADPGLIGQRKVVPLVADDLFDTLEKGFVDRKVPEANRKLTDQQLAWFDKLKAEGAISLKLSSHFLTAPNSREAEIAGMGGAILGSFFTMIVALALSFPVAVAAATYLEEFAPKNRWTDLIEVNINNLAAVPSIIFGLLGLAVFLNFFDLPRSTPLVGGMVLALMNLPIIIISTRAALRAVPPSIRSGALAIGASKMQSITHHVLPLAMPGILTGTILAMAHALGETAPLMLIGMVAFITDTPGSFLDSAAVMPVQIFMWSDLPERAFVEKTSGAIIVLLTFLVLMNAVAIVLRTRFERRW